MPSLRHPTEPIGNRLLDLLPREDLERIQPQLEIVLVAMKQVLHEPNEPISHVYFPIGGVVSLVTYMNHGEAIEMATVGREGMVGLPLFLGADRMPIRAFCQVPGQAVKLEASSFKAELERNARLTPLLNRYTQALFSQVAQSAACNRVHSIEQRCARWLLQTHDRVGTDNYSLTQEFLGQMLGVRRASVNRVAGKLQKLGFIRYSRGRIFVLDRHGLESTSCECYQIIRHEFERLLGSI